jgi:hypothetical protein
MELIILFGDEIIDSIELDVRVPLTSQYLAYLQVELICRNEELLNFSKDAPSFALDHVPSRANFDFSELVLHNSNGQQKNG